MIDAGPFAKALGAIEELTPEQQAEVLDLARQRLIERGREQLIEDVRIGRAEFALGEAKRVSAEELLREITS